MDICRRFQVPGAVGLLILLLSGCDTASTGPTRDDATKQLADYIQQCVCIAATRGGGSVSLAKVVTPHISVTDTRKIDASTVEVIFDVKYDVLRDFNSFWEVVYTARPLLPFDGKKGTTVNVTGIKTTFQRYEQRGWVFAGFST